VICIGTVVYASRQPVEVSWFESTPRRSPNFVKECAGRTTAIVDIGGGASRLADHLLDEGFLDVSVLDVSVEALRISQKRLGERSKKVKWIVADIRRVPPGDRSALSRRGPRLLRAPTAAPR
jgi:hypothetical protein